MIITWKVNPENLVENYELQITNEKLADPNPSWAAVGFSRDHEMGNDLVVMCDPIKGLLLHYNNVDKRCQEVTNYH